MAERPPPPHAGANGEPGGAEGRSAATGAGRRALVTGATGFVGSHLARGLAAAGWEVHVLARPGSALERVERAAHRVHLHDGATETMVGIVGEARPDVVFHLASLFIAEHRSADVTPLVESNLLLGTQLVEGMRAHGRTRLVNTGTAWQHYGGEAYDPVCLYAATKQAFVDLLRFFEEAAGLRVVTLELFDSYGPDDPRGKLMTALVRAVREGTPLAMSGGEQELELVHVHDIVRAFEAAAERLLADEVERHETYAVRGGEPHTLREVVETFARVAGRPLEAEWGVRPYRAREVMRPWSGGVTLPGWRAEIGLETGVRELLDAPSRSS